MHRTRYLAGAAYLAVCALVLTVHGGAPRAEPEPSRPVRTMPGARGGTGAEWFARMKPYCNALEVEIRQQHDPAPASVEGAGYGAACFALAGKIDRARAMIDRLPAGDRVNAAAIVFEIGHPVADAGDDQSAGPMMRLVVDYWPDHYMALYHAGVAEYALGDTALARAHLERFVALYPPQDGWRGHALGLLEKMKR